MALLWERKSLSPFVCSLNAVYWCVQWLVVWERTGWEYAMAGGGGLVAPSMTTWIPAPYSLVIPPFMGWKTLDWALFLLELLQQICLLANFGFAFHVSSFLFSQIHDNGLQNVLLIWKEQCWDRMCKVSTIGCEWLLFCTFKFSGNFLFPEICCVSLWRLRFEGCNTNLIKN